MKMSRMDFTQNSRRIGVVSAFALFITSVVYGVVTVLGLLSLKSPLDPIADPYFSLMELLILILAPLLVIVMASIHAYAFRDVKIFGMLGLIFVGLMAVITAGEHFVIFTVSRQIESAAGVPWLSLFFAFKWPSVIYTLDILAWDIFFALAVLFAAPVFEFGRLEKTVRILMLATGVLSLLGLIGVPLADMNVRNIGVAGYAGLTPIWSLLLGILFWRTEASLEETTQDSALRLHQDSAGRSPVLPVARRELFPLSGVTSQSLSSESSGTKDLLELPATLVSFAPVKE